MKFTTRVKPVKIRIISGGEEHSNLETLRKNFSVADLIDLIKDNRLSTWLRRLQESEMANKVEQLKTNLPENGDVDKIEQLCLQLAQILFETEEVKDESALKGYWETNSFNHNSCLLDDYIGKIHIDALLTSNNRKDFIPIMEEMIINYKKIGDKSKEDYRIKIASFLEHTEESDLYNLYKHLQENGDNEKECIESIFSLSAKHSNFSKKFAEEKFEEEFKSFDQKKADNEYLISLISYLQLANNKLLNNKFSELFSSLEINQKETIIELLKNNPKLRDFFDNIIGIRKKEYDIITEHLRNNNDFISSITKAAAAIWNIWNDDSELLVIAKYLSIWYAYCHKVNNMYYSDAFSILLRCVAFKYMTDTKGSYPKEFSVIKAKYTDRESWRNNLFMQINDSYNTLMTQLNSLLLSITNNEYQIQHYAAEDMQIIRQLDSTPSVISLWQETKEVFKYKLCLHGTKSHIFKAKSVTKIDDIVILDIMKYIIANYGNIVK